MNSFDSLEKANEIHKAIGAAKNSIDRWECATNFRGNIDADFKGKSYSYLPLKYLPFDICKMMSIKGYQDEIKQLEEEFNNLP